MPEVKGTMEPSDELRAAATEMVKYALDQGVDEGSAVGLFVPRLEIEGEFLGPFEIIVRVIQKAAEPEDASVAIVLRLTDQEIPEGSVEGKCALCGHAVFHEAKIRDEMAKVCVSCFISQGPDGVDDSLFGGSQRKN